MKRSNGLNLPLRAIVFDMDGLMVDTEPLSRRAWEHVLRPFGVLLTDVVYGRMIGRRSGEAVKLLLDAYHLPLTAEEIMNRKTAVLDELLVDELPIMPGLMALQAQISWRGIPWAVATSSPRRHAENLLRRLGLLNDCRALVGGDDVVNGKPAPDIYLLAAQRLGVLAKQCLALEDSLPGCQAATQAGMVTVVVPNGQTKTAEFACAHQIYPSLFQVAENLDALLRETPKPDT